VLLLSHGESHVVATFHPDDVTEVQVLEECAVRELFEPRVAVSCRVQRNGACFVPETTIGHKRPEASTAYSLVAAGDVIAVTEDANPEFVLVLYDLASGECWPYQGDREHHSAVLQRGERLLRRLNETSVGVRYALAGEAGAGDSHLGEKE
jgi:hypothetical protein